MFGYVIDVHDDGSYEVELSDPATGRSFAQVVVAPQDVVESPESPR